MFNIKKIKRDIALIKERKNMSDLRINSNIENGDLPKQMELFDGKKIKLEPITFGDCKIELKDMFNPVLLRKKFKKVNGHTNKDKE